MSSHGCYIVVKEEKHEIIYNKYLAVDALFILDLALGLKHLEYAVSKLKEVEKDSQDEKVVDLNEFCRDGFCYLEGAILINYDTKKIHFYEDRLLSKKTIDFIQDSSRFMSDYSGWTINYENQGFKKIAAIISQSLAYEDSDEGTNDNFQEEDDEVVNLQWYITGLICLDWDGGVIKELMAVLPDIPSVKQPSFIKKLLCKMGFAKPSEDAELNRSLLSKSIIKPENQDIVHDYIKANPDQYVKQGYNIDDIIILHERVVNCLREK